MDCVSGQVWASADGSGQPLELQMCCSSVFPAFCARAPLCLGHSTRRGVRCIEYLLTSGKAGLEAGALIAQSKKKSRDSLNSNLGSFDLWLLICFVLEKGG